MPLTQDQIEQLAKKYAYDILTCPGSPEDIDEVLDIWAEDKHHRDTIIWQPFEDCEPDKLLAHFENLEAAFLNCIKEFQENS